VHRARLSLERPVVAERHVDAEALGLELAGAVDQLAAGVHDERAAIEDELVLAADAVHVDHRHPVAARHLVDELAPPGGLLEVERRGVRDKQDPRARGGLHLGRAVARPRVLADHDPGDGLSDAPQPVRLGARREVARLVEDLVVRQERLVVHPANLPVARQRRADRHVAVARVPRAPRRHAVDRADHRRRLARLHRDPAQPVERAVDELLAQHEVRQRVAGEGELREDDHVGALILGPAHPVEDALRVAREVADHVLELHAGYAHVVGHGTAVTAAPSTWMAAPLT
jgi:hypothetical protein